MKYKIVVIDDHPIIAEGIENIISKTDNLNLVGSFAKALTLIRFIQSNDINLVILDINLSDQDGMDLCLDIRNLKPKVIILAFSNYADISAIKKILQNGANGYVLKNAPPNELLDCIYRALKGQLVFSTGVSEIMSRPEMAISSSNMILTNRETEILSLLAQGLTGLKIADLLSLSKFTVENHRKNMMRKMKVNNVAALIAEGTRLGFL